MFQGACKIKNLPKLSCRWDCDDFSENVWTGSWSIRKFLVLYEKLSFAFLESLEKPWNASATANKTGWVFLLIEQYNDCKKLKTQETSEEMSESLESWFYLKIIQFCRVGVL